MESIRKRGDSYLLVVFMSYNAAGRRCKPRQRTVHPPQGLTPKQTEKWLKEQATLLKMACKKLPVGVDRSMTLNQNIDLWLETVAPTELALSTLHRKKQDIARIWAHPPGRVLRAEVVRLRLPKPENPHLPQCGQGYG